MNKQEFIVGSHISLNKDKNYLLGTVKETIDNGANCFMIFTGAPQNKKRIPISNFFLEEAKVLASKHQISFNNCVVHAPYIINLATSDPENATFYIEFLCEEIKRTVAMGIKYIVLHPGFHNQQTYEEGMKNLIKNLQIVLDSTENLDYLICLETMAGKSNQLGKKLEEIQEIIKGCNNHKKLAVCLDTCHLHDAGYDLSKKDEFLKKFNELIGIEKIKVMHLGDSMNVCGSKKDRHANFGYGQIGFDVLMSWAYDQHISKIPIIVETPYWLESKPEKTKKVLISPYKHEIQLLKNKKWLPIPSNKYLPIFNIHKYSEKIK